MSDEGLPLLPLLLANVPWGLRCALEQEGVPTADWAAHASAAGRFVLYDSTLGRRPPIDPRQLAIDIHDLRSGCSADPLAALADTRSVRRGWQVGHLAASEEVSRCDKRAVRQQLLARLRDMIEAAGGVWMRIAPFPYPYRSAFNLRLDHDQYLPEDFDRILQATGGFEQALSHFVCGASFEGRHEALGRLRPMDVGSHGYRHHTYRGADESRRNIARGIDVLRQAGIEPSGFVAPHGRWPHGLGQVLGDLHISHSSEFALAYDDLPFFPDDSQTLQIPVHPVCLGICLEAADRAGGGAAERHLAADALGGYFRQIAQAKYQAGEPLFFYGHPDGRLGRYPQVVRRLLGTVSEFPAIWLTSMTQFGAWWRTRLRTRVRVYRGEHGWRVFAACRPTAYRMALECFRGEQVAAVPLDGDELRFSPAELEFCGRVPLPAAGEVNRGSPRSLRGSVLRYLDWEKETPLDEIATHHWRGWVKHRLRKWRPPAGRPEFPTNPEFHADEVTTGRKRILQSDV
jgi:hypothetical protein